MANATLERPDSQQGAPEEDPALDNEELPQPIDEQPSERYDAERLRQKMDDVRSFAESVKKKPDKSTKNVGDKPPPPPGHSSNSAPKNGNISSSAERIRAARDKFASAKDKYDKGMKAKDALSDMKDNAGEYAKTIAKDAAKKFVKQLAKKAGQAIARAAVTAGEAILAFFGPELLIGLGVLLVIVIAISALASLSSFGGLTGKGPGIYPNNPSQASQATLLAALGGDSISKNKLVQEIIGDEKDRYARMVKNAGNYTPELKSAVEAKAAEFEPRLDSILAEPTSEKRLEIKTALEQEMLAFEGTLPIGNWIAKIAEGHVGTDSNNFCLITRVRNRYACASVASTILWEAGVPNSIVGTTTALWNNPAFRLVIDRSNTPTADRLHQNQLQPGDVVWFGNGAAAQKRYAGALFNHVGIYVGDGQIVDNSSKAEEVLKRAITVHSGNNTFNGAKRYGADL